MSLLAEADKFEAAFTRWLLVPGSMCWERDVLRACKRQLWERWKEQLRGAEPTLTHVWHDEELIAAKKGETL